MARIRWWLGGLCLKLACKLLPPGTVSYRRASPDVPGTIVGSTYTSIQ